MNLPKVDVSLTPELKDIDSVDISLASEFKEGTFGDRLRKSRIELDLSISQVAKLCDVTYSVVIGYECNRYNPTKEVLDRLSYTFDIDYLCIEGYTKLIYNFNEFLEKLKLWIKENNLTRADAAAKLDISPGLFKFWFKGGYIKVGTYNKIKTHLNKYHLI